MLLYNNAASVSKLRYDIFSAVFFHIFVKIENFLRLVRFYAQAEFVNFLIYTNEL